MFYLAQAGAKLYRVNTAGTATELTLPTGITIDATRRSRFAVLGRTIVMTNSPSRNLAIAPDGTVRPMAIRPPGSSVLLAAGSATGLTGDYRAWQAFRIRDSVTGAMIAQSPLSPVSLSVTLADNDISVTGIAISADEAVNTRVLYRTTAGGALPFEWAELEGNEAVTLISGLSDAALALVPETPNLGIPPGTIEGERLELITSWKNRLWGKSTALDSLDTVLYSEDNEVWNWPSTNSLAIRPIGQDERGITGFIARRDELGIGKRDMLAKIVGDTPDDFEVVVVVMGVGPVSQESCRVVRDVGYFLGEDGVYTWTAEGVKSISRDTVHAWFNTDTYFNRALFDRAFSHYDPAFDAYVLHLAAAGSSDIDRWVMYTIRDGKWWGPHKTGAFTPTFAQTIEDANDVEIPIICGSDGKMYKPTSAFTDGTDTAIDFDVETKFFSGDAPDVHHYWGQPSIHTKIEAGGTLTVTPKVGRLDASAGTAISHDLTLGRERLRRLGVGPLAQLRIRQNTNAQGAQIYGLELPFHEVGRR
jgi:hypothetical protein